MPARKKRRSNRRVFRQKRGKKFLSAKLVVAVISAVLLLLLILFAVNLFQTTNWKDSSKLLLAVAEDGSDVTVYVVDPTNEELTVIVLPAQLEVEVSHQLGVWRLGSVWELGDSEKLEGELLVSTLVKHLKFPVYLWSDKSAEKYLNANPVSAVISSLRPGNSNLPIGDRFRIAIFITKIGNKRNQISLVNTRYLKSELLVDGESGYRLSGNPPNNLLAAISYPEFTSSPVNVRIEDATQKFGVAASVAGVINNLGGKVASVVRIEENTTDCEVWGRNKDAVEVLALVLSCDVIDSEDGLEVNLRLGQKFVERY
jgi:hypothetical protein